MSKKEKLRFDPTTGEFVDILDREGREIPDPTPVAPPVGFVRRQPLHERIRAMVQHEFQRMRDEGKDPESPEEADDFLIPEEDSNDPREARFAMMPGHEHEWEENFEPPRDFKDMHERLVAAGWKPPSKDSPASSAAASKDVADPPRGGSDGPGPAGAAPAAKA